MPGPETHTKRCRKCRWCATYYDFDVKTGIRTPVYCCQFGRGVDGKAPTDPTLDDACPYFMEPYEDEENEGE